MRLYLIDVLINLKSISFFIILLGVVITLAGGVLYITSYIENKCLNTPCKIIKIAFTLLVIGALMYALIPQQDTIYKIIYCNIFYLT